jgi:hypothetical protein
MIREKRISLLLGSVSVVSALFMTILPTSDLTGGNVAEATQPPPPPTYYTLTVNKSGGDSTCEVRIDSPGPSAWTTSSVQDSFVWGTDYEPTHQITCPSAYVFSHWESNDEDLDGWRENRSPDFTLTKNTTATAVFVPATGTLTVYVDDPTPGSSGPHPLTSSATGHTFWEFDGGCVPEEYEEFLDQEYGFYPEDINNAYIIVLGTKVWGNTPGELLPDYATDYTDHRTYTISYAELLAGLAYTKDLWDRTYTGSGTTLAYHVQNFNCTDAAIGAASAAGVTLPSAAGSCGNGFHTFNGNCPGTLGENLNP